MSKRSDQHDLKWAREQFPMLARRGDAELLRIVKEARGQLWLMTRAIVVAGGVAGALLAEWIKEHWLTEMFSDSGGFVFMVTAAGLVGYAISVAIEHVLRRRIDSIVSDPRRFMYGTQPRRDANAARRAPGDTGQ
ncbi:hypothetical protein [Wenzhouxiangella sp. XN24]|uniref:hypothetical protein n=1 Tax=Wenzhouxiangella sp. XN24 TaxID=2713569 RepID=UPI0013EAA990|nr:hypothetical protein [Wenzhouxiangella sp. XN24]NGX17556.1 hypothetical protein [Wenzhouxiangella sp. XN24]